MQLVLISGLSGSGKSIALHMLEDSGYYSVDNLPAQLLGEVMRFFKDAGYDRVAVAVDMRSGETVASLPQQLAELRQLGVDTRLIYLEAKPESQGCRIAPGWLRGASPLATLPRPSGAGTRLSKQYWNYSPSPHRGADLPL